ncbi:hypothetical protein ACQPW3_36175 [Actinosynnema sp. CA-248983]
MSSENSKARGITVTVKYNGDKAAPWAVFYGSPSEIRVDVISFFGLDPYAMEQRTLHELVQIASKVASGAPVPTQMPPTPPAQSEAQVMQLLKDELGATPIQEPAPQSDPWANAGSPAGSPPWDTLAAPAVNPLLAQIEACTSVQALKEFWVKNQAAFADGSLMDAYKAKGRSLKAVA